METRFAKQIIIMVFYFLNSISAYSMDVGQAFLDQPIFVLKKGTASLQQTKTWIKEYLKIDKGTHFAAQHPLKLEYKGCDAHHRWLFVENASRSGNSNLLYLVFSESLNHFNQKQYKYLGEDGFIFSRLFCYGKAKHLKAYLLRGWHMGAKDQVYQLEELTNKAIIRQGGVFEINHSNDALTDKIRNATITEKELLSLIKND